MLERKDVMKKFAEANRQDNVDEFRKLVKSYSSYLFFDNIKYYFDTSASQNNINMINYFLDELCVDINTPHTKDEPEGVIDHAAGNGAKEAVQLLINRGAKINFEVNGVTRCFPLQSASFCGHLEVVKILVENGADINATWNGNNALSLAIIYNQQEVVDYLRSKGAKTPAELRGEPEADSENENQLDQTELVLDHIKTHLGEPELLSSSRIEADSIKIYVVTMENGKALVTVGMSSESMFPPEGEEAYCFGELILYLPKNWPLDEKSLMNAKNFWPIDWMLRIAAYPFLNDTWLGGESFFIANDEPPQPLGPNTKMTCWMGLVMDPDLSNMKSGNGQGTVFYTLYPIYTQERDFEKKAGTLPLLQKFADRGIGPVLDIKRPNTCK